ncbi:DUF1801 domain-containing protein [Saccharomonospora azurea]|uniref:DUF1801 domain-containing protein n=1 Tax=Saccharomonospora azurea TaxID=40988 RepID=UPI003321AD89
MTTVSDYVSALPSPLRPIAEQVRSLIDDTLPETTGALWHGHPTWSLGERPGRRPVCLVKAHSSSVTFGLWRGQEVADPSGRLHAGARTMASVKLVDVSDIDRALFTDWLRQAVAQETR